MFATPEVHIGFHPDAAASFYLSHLTGHVGWCSVFLLVPYIFTNLMMSPIMFDGCAIVSTAR